MIRLFTALAMALLCSVNAQAALLASFNFNTNLNATSTYPGVTVTGFTPISSRMVYNATAGVGGSGAGQFINTTNQSFVDSATLTLSRAAGLTVNSLTFDIRKLMGSTNGELRISNNVTTDVFTVPANSTTWTTPVTYNLSANQGPSITFTFARRTTAAGSSTMFIDNFEIDGVVPEPASMAVFAGLGLAGFAIRRRNRKA